MPASFIEELMQHILEGTMIPKVQIERAVGPILSMFLADVLTETLKDDPELSGPIGLVCAEFPFKKQDNKQSTNIDWLLFNPERSQLIFLELKTADGSVGAKQSALYVQKQRAVANQGGSFLIDDLVLLRDASAQRAKYDYILKDKVLPLADQIAECREARIIYLVPQCSVSKLDGHADRVLSFSALADSIPGPYAEEWKAIRAQLCQLDISPKRAHYAAAVSESEHNGAHRGAKNYADREDLDSVLDRCRQSGEAVVVGFDGGMAELLSSEWSYLEGRKYKWDWAAGGIGFKLTKNWMPGSVFLEAVGTVRSQGRDARQGLPTEFAGGGSVAEPGAKWQGTLKFTQMAALCAERGDEVIIGFTGGQAAFLGKTLSELRARPSYKWDYSSNLAGKKRADWLPGGMITRTLRDHHGYGG